MGNYKLLHVLLALYASNGNLKSILWTRDAAIVITG